MLSMGLWVPDTRRGEWKIEKGMTPTSAMRKLDKYGKGSLCESQK
jgi:hypothetical protein